MMLDFIESFKECRLIILGKYHYFTELLHSVEHASPEETTDFWKVMAPLHHRLDTDEINKDFKTKRYQTVKAYATYFNDFYKKCLTQIDSLLTTAPSATTLDEETCKSIFVFYMTLSLYSEIGTFMISTAHNENITLMRQLNNERKKLSITKGLYTNKDIIIYLKELKMIMSQENSLTTICRKLMKVLVNSNAIDNQFTHCISYHSCFVTQLGRSAPITKLLYSPKTLLKKIDNQVNEINHLFLQHLKTLPAAQMVALNSQRTQLITRLGKTKLQTQTFSQEPLWIKENQTSLDILDNYQSLLRISAELTHLKTSLLQVVTATPVAPIISSSPIEIPQALPAACSSPSITSITSSELPSTVEVTAVSESAEFIHSSNNFSSSSSSSSNNSSSSPCSSASTGLYREPMDKSLLSDSIDTLSQELTELNLVLAWDYERSKEKKMNKARMKSSSSSSSSSSSITQDPKLRAIAANLEKCKEEFKQLFTHHIHMVYTEKFLQKIIALVGGSIVDAEGSRKRIVIDQTASDTLSQSKMVIHQQHGPKAKSRATLPSFIVKNYRCVLQNAGFTPEKLWPLDYVVSDAPISSVRCR